MSALPAVQTITDELTRGSGYVLLEGLLPARLVQRIRLLLRPLAKPDSPVNWRVLREEKRDRVYGLLWWDAVFQEVLLQPPILDVAKAFLGSSQVALSSYSAHLLRPGCLNMGIHVDYPYFAMPEPLLATPTLGLQAIVAVDDFEATNGAPYFVPGSQKRRAKPRDDENPADKVQILAGAGSVLLAHAMCWHDTTPNRSTGIRTGLLANFTPYYVRPIENPYFGWGRRLRHLPPDLGRSLAMPFYDWAAPGGQVADDPRWHRRMRDLEEFTGAGPT